MNIMKMKFVRIFASICAAVIVTSSMLSIDAQAADKVCGYLLYHTFGFTYVEYVETPVKKDNRTGKNQ